MQGEERQVRSRDGLIPCRGLDYFGHTIQDIKAWRSRQHEAGLPSALRDFYTTHGLCPECSASGVQMIGWSAPRNAKEIEGAKELDLEELPLYEMCPGCGGSGQISISK